MNLIEKVAEFQTIAKLFAESGMFPDTKAAAQVFVKIMAGAELGLPPFTAMNAFHIINGKVTLAAGTIAARIKGSGRYNYRVVEKTATRCTIEFLERGQRIHVETWDANRAKTAGVGNMAKYPDAMLFSRAISAGARVACPDVIGSYYTPEEMGAEVDEDGEVMPVVTIGAPQDEPQPIAIEAPAPAAPALAAPKPAAKAASAKRDDSWKDELTRAGKRAAEILQTLTDLPAEQRQQLEAAVTLARDVFAKNGSSTADERATAIAALKQALGESA